MKHTKGLLTAKRADIHISVKPWRVYQGTKIICKLESYDRFSKDANIEEEANAKRIVKCWNSHDELLNMLGEMNSLIERIDLRSKHDPYPLQIKAKELIKKATE